MKISARGWLMIVVAAAAETCAMGFPLTAYSTIVIALQKELDTTRALVSTALGLETVILALLAPLVGTLIVRRSLKKVMLFGAALSFVGYLALAFVHSIWVLLAIYACIIGPGMSFMGVVPATTLITRWFVKDRGKVLGIVHLPFIGFLGPPVAAYLALHYGTQAVFLALAATFVLVAPLLFLIVDWPAQRGERAWGDESAVPETVSNSIESHSAKPRAWLFFGSTAFWLISLSSALLSGGADIFHSNVAGLALEHGLSMTVTSVLIPVAGVGGFLGSIACGWLGDRIGAVKTFILVALTQVATWVALLLPLDISSISVVVFLIGTGIGAIVPLQALALAEFFPIKYFSRALGFTYWVKMPFIFGAGPLAGYIFDKSGSYSGAIGLQIVAYVATAGLAFALLVLRPRTQQPEGPERLTMPV